MGNSSSSGRGHHDDTVDFGHLTPQGVYTGPRDWNQQVVSSLIVERRLAPFYRPLEDYEEGWDDERILAARKEPPESDGNGASVHIEAPGSLTPKSHHKRSSASREPGKFSEGAIYRGAVECPICFLYYPSNINHSRCCDQAICTECFVQIKRAEPTATHLVSEPAACPYCVQENFGVTYTPPAWRAGLGSDGSHSPSRQDFYLSQHWQGAAAAATNPQTSGKKRRKSFGADSPEVVTIDQIRPDWEQKLAAVRAAVTRRANRRIIMRQVGDRLIPVGVTSGRVHALPEGAEGAVEGADGSRRSRRRGPGELNQFMGSMGLGGQDLEELMMMEAMRLSLLDHEERQRKEREEQQKNGQTAGESGEGNEPEPGLPSSAPSSSAPIPVSRNPASSASTTSMSLPTASLVTQRLALSEADAPGSDAISSPVAATSLTSASPQSATEASDPLGATSYVQGFPQPWSPSSSAVPAPELPSTIPIEEPTSTLATETSTSTEPKSSPPSDESRVPQPQSSLDSTASSVLSPAVTEDDSYAALASSSEPSLADQPLLTHHAASSESSTLNQ